MMESDGKSEKDRENQKMKGIEKGGFFFIARVDVLKLTSFLQRNYCNTM